MYAFLKILQCMGEACAALIDTEAQLWQETCDNEMGYVFSHQICGPLSLEVT